jgi:hypothetical protein
MTTSHYKVDPRHAKELWAGLPHIEPPLITVSDEPLDVVKRLLKASELARLAEPTYPDLRTYQGDTQ